VDAPATDVAAAEAMLPMLLGIAAAQGLPLAEPGSAGADPAALASSDDGDAAQPIDPSSLVPLALPAVAASSASVAADGGRGEAPLDRAAATTSATTPAILAAAADAARRGETHAGRGKADDALANLAAEQASSHAAHRTDATVQAQAARGAEQPQRIEAPVGSRQWDGEFANRLAWMVGKQEQRAELVLTPPQLGRVEVSLAINGEQATAIFTSASASVRDAIENALPRLREVLQEAGITLGQAQVGSESPQQPPAHKENGDNRGNAAATAHDARDGRGMPPGFAVNAPTAWVSSGRGMIDIFA
jgi:flagellar hook-length control protein FliK